MAEPVGGAGGASGRRRADDGLLALALEGSPIGMCLVAPGGLVLEVNAALCRMLGRDRPELLGSDWQALGHPDELGIDTGSGAELFAGRLGSYRLLRRYLRPDGSVAWGDVLVAAVRDDAGTVLCAVCQVVDVSAVIAAHRALEESEERFRLLAAHASDVVYRANADGLATWMAPSVTAALGWTPSELLGTRVAELLHPDDLRRTLARRAAVYAGADVPQDVGGEIVRLRTRDGGYRWMAATLTPVRDADGRPDGLIGGVRDVDALVRAQHAARADRDRLRAALDALLDPLVLLEAVRDPDGRVVDFVCVDANPAASGALGLGRAALVGGRLLDVLSRDQGPGALAWCAGAMESGAPLLLEDRPYQHRPGAPVLRYDVRGRRVGDVLGLTWRDVTDRHEAEERLLRRARVDPLTGLLNRREGLDRLGSALAHEPRTGRRMAVAFCDLDGFKLVNDRLGHAAGDELLRAVAARIAGAVRVGDVVARIGGDEILVLLDGVHDLAGAVGVARKIRDAVVGPVPVLRPAANGTSRDTVVPSVSIGVALAEPGEDLDALMARADRAMYAAKEAGRDRVVALPHGADPGAAPAGPAG